MPDSKSLAATVVVAGYSTGGVRLFHGGNGTVLGSVEADGEVLAVKRSGQVMLYNWVFRILVGVGFLQVVAARPGTTV